MDASISREEHEEFRRRIEEENLRQNKRIELLENNMQQIITQQLTNLTSTIERLNLSISNILKEQAEISGRLEKLENRDGEKWRKVVETVITVVVSAAVGFALAHIGM